MKNTVIILLVCLVAVSVLAANNNTSITINAKTSLNGQSVEPGNYKVVYDIKGETADVKIMQNGKTVATATGQVVEVKDATHYNSVVNQSNPDGTQTVIEIQFANKKNVIRFNSDNTAVGK